MPSAISSGITIRENIPAANAYTSLIVASREIASAQLRLSTGKRINSAADDVAGYITSRALSSRVSALKTSVTAVGEGQNVTAIAMDSLDQIAELLANIKDAAAQASSGALGTDEKVALAKAGYRLAQQIQFITDSTVFGGHQLLQGGFSGNWVAAYDAQDKPLLIGLDLTLNNTDFNINGNKSNSSDYTNAFDLNATNAATAIRGSGSFGAAQSFAGVAGFNLENLNAVADNDLGIFSSDKIALTLTSFSQAIKNVTKVGAYVGGMQIRFSSQKEVLYSQITNYKAAISRIEDTDVAEEQMKLIKNQFLQQSSLSALSQSMANYQMYLQLLRG